MSYVRKIRGSESLHFHRLNQFVGLSQFTQLPRRAVVGKSIFAVFSLIFVFLAKYRESKRSAKYIIVASINS